MPAKSPTSGPLYSGELARLAGVSTDTLRFYERSGLLPPAARSAAGYRLFGPDALVRVKLIRAALSIGFSVGELSEVLRERDHGGAPCRWVRALAEQKLATVEAYLRDLKRWRRELQSTLRKWDRLLRSTPERGQAHLLEVLATARKGRAPGIAASRPANLKQRKR